MVVKLEEMNDCGVASFNADGSSKVVKSSSSSSSSVSSPPQEKGRKNKRKLAEPTSQQNAVSSLTEFPRYELNSLKPQSPFRDNDSKAEESESTGGWDDPFAYHLEELLSRNLLTLFRSAMKQIVDCGYREDVVLKAISGSRLYCGGNDLVSNIVNDTLSFLKSGKKVCGLRDYVFEDLHQLVAYTLVEKISLVREVKPSLSTVEAMWRLLMCDLNVLQAIEVDEGSSGLNPSKPSESAKPNESDNQKTPVSNPSESDNSKAPVSNPSESDKPKAPVSNPNETVRFGSFSNAPDSKNPTPGKEIFSGPTSASDETSAPCRKNRTKKEMAMLRQKSCVEKIRNYNKSSGGSYKSSKLSSVGGFLVEKRGKSSVKAPSVPESKSDTPAETVTAVTSEKKTEEKTAPSVTDYYAGIPFDKTLGVYVPRNKRDELVMKLVPRMNDLDKELQVWTDWANQKVKQATSRLLKDQPELKALRKEKEEAEEFRREKQLLEENTIKRSSEIELALNNATNQLEKAHVTVRRLEMEQALLLQEREAANRKAVETAANCREAKERVQRSLKDSQSWEGQKVLLQEELKSEKDKVSELQREVDVATNRRNQIEATWKQEKAAKGKLVAQAAEIKKEKEKLEEFGKEEEERIKSKAEDDLKHYIEDIKRMESEISKLKLKSDSLKIAALKNGNKIGESWENQQEDGAKIKRERECVMCLSEEMSVIFLPCAHQVLCTNCNQLHEKETMEDCPSCRAKIQSRIQARFARG